MIDIHKLLDSNILHTSQGSTECDFFFNKFLVNQIPTVSNAKRIKISILHKNIPL